MTALIVFKACVAVNFAAIVDGELYRDARKRSAAPNRRRQQQLVERVQ